jgi:bisphosphoglycerate-dependent phosphoglycerate mutase
MVSHLRSKQKSCVAIINHPKHEIRPNTMHRFMPYFEENVLPLIYKDEQFHAFSEKSFIVL